MPGRYARSTTATRVSEFIGTRSGRRFLREHSWEEGMPIVVSQPHELLTEAMGLVATQNDTALVALVEPTNDELLFIYISLPNKNLEVVPTEPPRQTILDFYRTVNGTFARTFRVRGWKYSAIAHAINTCDRLLDPHDILHGSNRGEVVPTESTV